VPTPTSSLPAGLQSPCASSLGIAYEPDGGNGNGFNGIQVTHFEDDNEHLCSALTPASVPAAIRLDSSASSLAVAQDESVAIALLFNASSGGYAYAQDIFGAEIGQLVPAGSPYDLALPPTPVPLSSPPATPTPTPAAAALITNGSSTTILGDATTGGAGVALVVSPNTSPQGIVAMTSLMNSPPQYGEYVPFSAPTYTLKHPVGTSFDNIRALTDTSNANLILVRGLNDLIAVGVTIAGSGYQLDVKSEDTKLGSYQPLLGYGRMAIDPAAVSHALIGGTTAGNTNVLTLVTGLPTTITESSTLALSGAINSIAYTPTYGTYAAIGTTAGIVIVGGTDGSTLSVLHPFGPDITTYTPTFTNCNGTKSVLTNIASVAFSADLKYLVALGTGSGVSCASGYNATIVAIPFLAASGATPAPSALATPTANPTGSPSPSPEPKFFQQNNVIPPPANADFLFVH
jgi:hypothetical protein